MGLERMKCCGELTHVYADAGNRRHAPGCEGARMENDWPTLVALAHEARVAGRSAEAEEIYQALGEISVLRGLLREAVSLIERLSFQQAMPDDFYVKPLERMKKFL